MKLFCYQGTPNSWIYPKILITIKNAKLYTLCQRIYHNDVLISPVGQPGLLEVPEGGAAEPAFGGGVAVVHELLGEVIAPQHDKVALKNEQAT